jgi:predicted ATP-grasp superfamily ATP-dependent carboligase
MGFPAWGTSFPPYAPPITSAMSAPVEVDALKAQAGYLEQALQSLRQRIQKMESEAKTE